MLTEIKNLSKAYQSGQIEVHALKDINLQIEAGEFTAIVGPSGSGKTTLLNIIGAIDTATGGDIIFNGQHLAGQSSDELADYRKENLGFIFQTYNLIPVLSVFENIEMPLRLLNRYTDQEIAAKIDAILDKVGLAGYQSRMPAELSGGQQQRVSVARALVKKPKLILADEPTANLDSANGEALVALMEELNRNEGITFIFSTHDQLIMKHARRLITLRDGMVDEDERR